MALRRDYMEPRRFVDLEKWNKKSLKKDPVPPVQKKPADGVEVSVGGPHEGGLPIPEGSSGWNAGDIDFRWDGAIFIRNPYLADAIERHLQAAYQQSIQNGSGKFLRIVRDEGWSGSETNIVC